MSYFCSKFDFLEIDLILVHYRNILDHKILIRHPTQILSACTMYIVSISVKIIRI